MLLDFQHLTNETKYWVSATTPNDAFYGREKNSSIPFMMNVIKLTTSFFTCKKNVACDGLFHLVNRQCILRQTTYTLRHWQGLRDNALQILLLLLGDVFLACAFILKNHCFSCSCFFKPTFVGVWAWGCAWSASAMLKGKNVHVTPRFAHTVLFGWCKGR